LKDLSTTVARRTFFLTGTEKKSGNACPCPEGEKRKNGAKPGKGRLCPKLGGEKKKKRVEIRSRGKKEKMRVKRRRNDW